LKSGSKGSKAKRTDSIFTRLGVAGIAFFEQREIPQLLEREAFDQRGVIETETETLCTGETSHYQLLERLDVTKSLKNSERGRTTFLLTRQHLVGADP